jgi:hypothetical protein
MTMTHTCILPMMSVGVRMDSVGLTHPSFHLSVAVVHMGQGGTARQWEGELEETENRLREHLDMLVKSETISGYARDRARERDRIGRYDFIH